MIGLSLRLEIHDGACNRCGQPKPSGDECMACALENAIIGSLRGPSCYRAIDEAEKARNERRKENGV